MTRHIFLIGFMGSGKTRWGRVVAENLGSLFLDLDTLVEENEGKTIPDIFSASGEKGFRILEQECLHRLAAMPSAVVATGGGTPCFFDNMDWMKRRGTTIYLKTSPEMLCERLQNEQHNRPLLKNLDKQELLEFIQTRLSEREPYYRQADFVIEQTGDEDVFLKRLISAASQ
jgi:shikimate kinase